MPALPRGLAIVAGIAFLIAGAWCLHDAFERRGVAKPFWVRFLPGM